MNAPIRQDGYMSILAGLNTPGLDRSIFGGNSTGWRKGLERFWSSKYNYFNYADLYNSNGLAQKIIDRPSDDTFQRGLEIEGDDNKVMANEFDRLNVLTQFANAIRWSRLFGGAFILLIAKDGGLFEDELNLNNLDEVSELKVFDITCLRNTGEYYTDFADVDNYGKIQFYTINPPGAQQFRVHESRIIPIGGEPLPLSFYSTTTINWSGRPVLEGCITDIMRYNMALEWSLRLLERKQQAVYQMEGLGEMFANGDDAIVQKRINLVDMVRGNLNSVVVDSKDTYTIQNLGLDGIDATIEKYSVALCAASNIPKVILFGDTVGGLNTSANSNLESYYSMVSHIREVIARPGLEKLVSILYLQKTIAKNDIPDEWHILFNPLWQPTELEQAQTKQSEGTADQLAINNLIVLLNNGIVSAEEVRKVVVNDIYGEYEFDDALPSDGGDINYSEGVDVSMFEPTATKPKPAGQVTDKSTQKT